MSNNVVKKKNTPTEQLKNDSIINRLMIMFVLSVVAIVALLLIKKRGPTEAYFVMHVLPALTIISGIGFVIAFVFFCVQRSRHVDDKFKVVNSINITCVTLGLFLSSLLYKYVGNTKILVAVIAVTILYFVYRLYQKDFFWFSLITTISATLLYANITPSYSSTIKNIISMGFRICSIVFPVLVIISALILIQRKGIFSFGEKKYTIMKSEYKYYPFFVSASITLAGSAIAFLINGIAIYSIIALLAAYLVIAIIYTVKMI